MKNKNSDHILTPDERALHIRSSIHGLQRIYGECLAKYEEDGNLDSLRLAFECQVQITQMLKTIKEEYSYGYDFEYGR